MPAYVLCVIVEALFSVPRARIGHYFFVLVGSQVNVVLLEPRLYLVHGNFE